MTEPSVSNACRILLGFALSAGLVSTSRGQCGALIELDEETWQTRDRAGTSVAVDGDSLLVGIPFFDALGTDAGTVAAYRRVRSTWHREALLFAPDTSTGDQFGGAVSVWSHTVAIGASHGGDRSTGVVYLFKRRSEAWVREHTLVGSDSAIFHEFGARVSLHGDLLITSAPGHDREGIESGAVYVFRFDGKQWQEEQILGLEGASGGELFGLSLDVWGSRIAVGAPFDQGGSVTLFKSDGERWTATQKIRAGSQDPTEQFGRSLSLGPDGLLVGAPMDDTISENAGGVYAFARIGDHWELRSKIFSPTPTDQGRFGTSIARSGSTLFVGARTEDVGEAQRVGQVHGFLQRDEEWIPWHSKKAADPARGDGFGASLAFDGQTIVIGAPGRDTPQKTDKGTAFVLEATALSRHDLYGRGWPGTHGVPIFEPMAWPDLGTTLPLAVGNSAGRPTEGLLVLGVSPTSLNTELGGTLLVSPMRLVPISLEKDLTLIFGEIPDHPALCGTNLYLQSVQRDEGASAGVSFTRGLRLTLGSS